MTQAELAKRTGISVSAIGRIEAGYVVPSAIQLFRLATALHVTVEDLCDRRWLREQSRSDVA